MQKALLRQLKRSIGVADEAALQALLEKLSSGRLADDPEIGALLRGFGDFIGRVDTAYEQYERDLELRTRSLEISSQELSGLNEKLRQELAGRENVLRSLRQAILSLLPDEAAWLEDSHAIAVEDIGALSKRLADLVAERSASQRALANQKFALDQHAIVSITDVQGRIVYANDRFCEISGYSRQELLGQNHRIVKSGVHSPAFFQEMWSTITAGQVWHGEVCNRARSGALYWVSASIVPLLGEDGLPEQYIGIRTDITDRKQMETQLSDQLHLVEELIEAIPLPVYLKDVDGRYIRLNRAFELFFNTQRQNYIGRTMHDLLSPEDAKIHFAKDCELIERAGTQSYETEVHGRDGRRHDAIYRKAALTRRDGTVHGLLGIIIDITERKQAEAEVLLAKESAEAASRAKSEFLANMSHEIRTPMNGVIGMTDLALDTDLDDEQREYLSIVKSSAEALLTIINDILDFSKIEAGKLLVEHIAFDLPRVISDSLKTLSLRAHEKDLELVCEILPGVPSHLLGDPSRLRQVVLNLVGNAIKFTEQGEIALRIALKAQKAGRAILHFSVSDTGIGISPEKQQIIFDAFAQEDSSTTRRYGGTGLGLSISRRLVELMGGEMWLESALGQGSIFHFSVNLQIDEYPAQARQDAFVDLCGRRILVVDDNDTNRRVLAGMLAAWEIESVLAPSAVAACREIAQAEQPFDCIILDAHMPEMDGYQLAAQLQRTLDTVPPMLMLSSGALRGDAQRCQEVGIVGFFSKPIAAEELLAALCRVFGLTEDVTLEAGEHLVTRHSLNELHRPLEILLVEDHLVNQRLAIGLLDKWGHRTTLANHGQEALDHLAGRNFDLILMDMQMPVMGGIEATRLIRQREAAIGRTPVPIIAMTAAAMQGDREACLQAGMNDYVSKPIKARALLEKLLSYGAQIELLDSLPSDFDYREALQRADQETVEIIAAVFLDLWPQDIARMRTALAADDALSVERAAHSLRGTLATFNATPPTRIAADIEARAHAGHLEGLGSEIDALQGQIAALAAALQAHCPTV